MMVTDTIRALIVDDEPVAREMLCDLLEQEPGVTVVGKCANGEEALEWLRREIADLLFLDVRMPGLDGFQTLERLAPERRPAVVFVTAYDEFAVRAFEVQAVDYLLKPFDAERLRQTLQRVRGRIASGQVGELSRRLDSFLQRLAEPRSVARHIAVRDGQETVLVNVANVDWFESESNYVKVHVGDRHYLARSTLGGLERQLDAGRFVRIHRTAIVNLDRIDRLVPCGHGDARVRLTSGAELTLSRRYRDRLERVLKPLG